MKDMMISDMEKKENSEHLVMSDEPKYPYGLKLYFDENSYKKLGLSEAPMVGQKFMLIANAEVCEVRQSRYEGDEVKMCMEMQIMEIDIKPKEKEKDIANELYGSKES